MKKNELNKKPKSGVKPDLGYSFLLLLYVLVPVITPGFGAVDSNGPKFLMLAALNLLSYIYMSSRQDWKSHPAIQREFFTSPSGLTYLLFLLISLLSFVRAGNIFESLLQFSKTFTVFSSVFVLYLIFKKDNRFLTRLVIFLVFILLVDCLTVFYNIVQFINGKLPGISEIKSVYSNKNILASAIFVKIPFALWLLLYGRSRWKSLGLVAIFFGVTATLLMSTRAFYLGLVMLTLTFASFTLVKYFQSGEKFYISGLVKYVLVVVIAFASYTFIQDVLYPKNKDVTYNVPVAERLSTINTKELSAATRLMAWKNSFELIKGNPLLGVGTGNWKIVDVKYENQVFSLYQYIYKSHNDFLEITAETGVFGGLAFLFLFLFVFLDFIRTFFKSSGRLSQEYLFIPAFGLLCYSVDAFFNFPADRPEIQMLFAVFISSGIFCHGTGSLKSNFPRKIGSPAAILYILLMLATIYFLISNVISLRYQRIAWEENQRGKLVTSSAFMKNAFPAVPGIGAYGEAISTIKASYLLEDGKYDELISLLKNDKSSPYDTRRENQIGRAYARSGRLDSALIYFKDVNDKKPLLYSMVSEICNISTFKGDFQTAIQCISSYLKKFKGNRNAWLEASSLYEKSGDLRMSLAMIDSSLKYHPNDSLLHLRQVSLKSQLSLKGYENIYKEGVNNFNKRNYAGAIKNFTSIIDKSQDITEAFEYRSKCYYFLGQYEKSVSDIDVLIKRQKNNQGLYNVRGVCNHNLGKDEEACQDFETARKMGDADAEVNFRKFCVKKAK